MTWKWFLTRFKKEMRSVCSEERVEFFIESIDGSHSVITEFVCGSHKTTDDSDSYFNATVWEPLKDIVNSKDEKLLAKRHKYKSALGTTIAIISHFEM